MSSGQASAALLPRARFGRTGETVSAIALGTAQFGLPQAARDWDPMSASGKKIVLDTINTALDLGINLIDTAPNYGDGFSERVIGEVMRRRRSECLLATKVRWRELSAQQVAASVHASMRRMQVDVIDLVQIHGGTYSLRECEHILHGGPLEALEKLRETGEIRIIGLSTDESFSSIELLRSGRFDVVQMDYSLIYQTPALPSGHHGSADQHALDVAREVGMGIATARSLTSGVLQNIIRMLVPGGDIPGGVADLCLKFLRCDSRVDTAIVGMRWPDEVRHNAEVVAGFVPPMDFAKLPRHTLGIYQLEDDLASKGT